MCRGKSWAVLMILALTGCGPSKPFRDMVGYVPPTSLPAQPKRTLVQDRPDKVWNNLVAFLQQSDFGIDHVDRDKRLIVARYSGNPEPFIDCGSIVTHENGALGQIAGSAKDVSLNYRLDDRPVILRRGLNLDSRVIIRLQEQRLGTIVSTDTTYVVTKTVDIENNAGKTSEDSRETVSFSAGKREEFSKGTACQPNGSLDVAILQSLPNVIGSNEITRADLPIDSSDPTADIQSEWSDPTERVSGQRWDNNQQPITQMFDDEHLDAAIVPPAADNPMPMKGQDNWTFPETGQKDIGQLEALTHTTSIDQQQIAALDRQGQPPAPRQDAVIDEPQQPETALSGKIDDTGSIVDETTRTLLASLDCQGVEWHFCDAIEITTPYRKSNIEKAAGLTVNTVEGFATQFVGNDLELDVALPNFPSFLHIIYLDRTGMIEQIMESSTLWPANLIHHLQGTGHSIPSPSGLAMIVAFVTEHPLMSSALTGKHEARAYLSDLKRRLAEIRSLPKDNQVMASQLLINVE